MKCPSCEAKWHLGKSANKTMACPFCGASLADKDEQSDTGTIQGVMRTLILERGAELYKKESTHQLKALLDDMAAGFPRELKVLNHVIQEGVQERLLKADDGTDEEKREAATWCRKYLTEYAGMADERVAEAVNILAAGLGWKPPLEAKPKEPATGAAQTSAADNGLLTIENGMVTACRRSATAVVIPAGVTSIGIRAFESCESLTSITIPNSVTSISTGAFAGCNSLASITIPNGITSIAKGTFAACGFVSIAIPNSVTSIREGAFSGCFLLTSITIPNGVTSIAKAVFLYCESLTSISIPNSVTSIGELAFGDCKSLPNITIPSNVTLIEQRAFYGCKSLANIRFGGTKTQWQNVEKGYDWNSGVPAHAVHCTDGDVNL